MATFSNFLLVIITLSFIIIPTSHQLNQPSKDDGFISLVISNNGLEFARELIVNKAVSSMLPLELPDIEKKVKIPLIGTVDVLLSDIRIDSLDLFSSVLKTGDEGLEFAASAATASLSMNWKYSYTNLFVTISDNGVASVQVDDMEVGFTAGLKVRGGSLQLSALDCGCQVEEMSIHIDGGVSWLYEGVVEAFEGKIRSTIETKITDKIKEGISQLDSLFGSLPKELPVDGIASLNVTFVSDPVLTDSSMEFEINGLFTEKSEVVVSHFYHEQSPASISCKSKMLGISLHEDVFNSASVVLFNDYKYWIVQGSSDWSFLNTASWKQIIPELYEKYPAADMNLNISVPSPPVIKITDHDISTTAFSDVTINVLDSADVIPVACISLEISGSASAEIMKNSLKGRITLNSFIMAEKWSKVGDIDTHLVEEAISTLLNTILLPYVNLNLMKGFPLPSLHGFALEGADIFCKSSRLNICTDVVLAD